MPFQSARLRAGILGVLLLAISGCGFLFVEGPPVAHEQMATVVCTDSRLAPNLDIALGAFFVLSGLVVAVDNDSYYSDRGAIVAIDGLLALLSGLSASSGYKKVRECRSAKELLARRSDGGDVSTVTDSTTTVPEG